MSTGSQECITFSGVTNFEIHHNEVFESGGSNNGGEGIDTKENCSNGKVYNNVLHDLSRLGIYADCWDKTLQNVEIYNNKIYNCSEGIVLSSENGGTLTNVKVYNNITYNNNNFGITVSDYGTNGLRQNISIMNNTVYKNGYGDSNTGWGGGIIILTTNVSKINIFNNIVSNNDAMQISDKSGVASVSVNENLIYGYHGLGWTFEVKGINVIESDPLFVDVDGIDNILGNPDDDLDVTAGSPSINNGINKNAPGFDFNNFKRPAESIVDIGAFEHNSVLLSIINSSPDALLSNSVEVYPNPSNEDIYIKILRKVDLIEIIDSRGSVLQKYSSPNECLLKVAISAQGLYMIRVSEGGLSELYRVVNY